MSTSSLNLESPDGSVPVGQAPAMHAPDRRTGAPASVEGRGLAGLFALVRSQRARLSLSSLSAFLASVCGVVPFLCIYAIAEVLTRPAPERERLLSYSAVLAVSVLARYALLALSTVWAHTAAFRLLFELRAELARKLGAVPLSFFARRNSAQVKRTLLDDVHQLESVVAHYVPDGSAAVSTPLLVTSLLFFVDYRMALASIAMAPLALVVMIVATRGIEDVHRDWLRRQDQFSLRVLEFFRGIEVVKTFGTSARTFANLAQISNDNTRFISDLMRKNGGAFALFQTLLGSSWVVLVPVGGLLYSSGSLSLPKLLLFMIVGPQLLTSSTALIFAWEGVKKVSESSDRVWRFLQEAELREAPTSEARAPTGPLAVVFDAVCLEYEDGRPALQHVSIEAPAGKVTALVGPSGAGKTSLSRLVARLWEPTSGRVLVGGKDVQAWPIAQLLQQVSMVFQDVFLLRGTVKENLLLAKPDASFAELVDACRVARAHDFIQGLPKGYDTELGERGARLSGGEKQRLSIARAVLKNAPILILDEATAFADAENEALIQSALRELCVDRTVLVIAHRLSTVASADQIVVLERGRVAECGRHEELLAHRGLYHQLWQRQSSSLDWQISNTSPKAAP